MNFFKKGKRYLVPLLNETSVIEIVKVEKPSAIGGHYHVHYRWVISKYPARSEVISWPCKVSDYKDQGYRELSDEEVNIYRMALDG